MNASGRAFTSSSARIEQAFGTIAIEDVSNLLDELIFNSRHGDMPRWQQAVEWLSGQSSLAVDNDSIVMNQPAVGRLDEINPQDPEALKAQLMQLHPWRKGPFRLGSLMIDTEWRSDLKWDRIGISPGQLAGKHVLDVGCGSGYHCWRMLGSEADLVVGIDPTLLFAMQFAALWQFIPTDRFCFLPVGIERLPSSLDTFDVIFSMGILYHRRSPIEHVQQMLERLRPGGTLYLETLVLEGEAQCLIPESRYAKMRNVWFIPSVDIVLRFLARCGFRAIEVQDISITTEAEQRRTDWMQFESLADFLDPQDSSLTIEGYPAPRRAMIRATRP